MTIHNKLLTIQQELHAPKGQYNSFGKYTYRSCEDILTAVKPLLQKVGCTLTITDSMVNIGEFNYIQANAILSDVETGESYNVSGFARESVTKKGMDDSQITGSTSSYARKYALSGLLCCDDTADADATNKHDNEFKGEMPPMAPAPSDSLGI